ncbi:DUF7281 domain-containing protein [Pseudomonas aeruginosa]|uniref:DUF7281 domain-containing protein n=1 Tax=Pseudomonas aeruginosa TaxID=287 RepID=UPI0013C50F0F|nr:hypothetical protein [Pseudomonas aeruginosa]HBO3146289.1 hypothetical protein [Pseudomonas aeruginosa]HCL4166283.1 hypothetical protein [Pseudomonas aeruginosa]
MRKYLQDHGIDPATDPAAWSGLARHEALKLGVNEKYTSENVRKDRVAIKTLPGRPLLVGSDQLMLPPSAHLDLNWQWVAKNSRHESVLLIENWESFELTHKTPFLHGLPGNPLVVFRGAPYIYNNRDSISLLKALQRVVFAFVDFDPEGLVIANALPHFARFLAPSDAVLEKLMGGAANKTRYEAQLGQNLSVLDSLDHPDLVRVQRVIRSLGMALPQERLIGLEGVSPAL